MKSLVNGYSITQFNLLLYTSNRIRETTLALPRVEPLYKEVVSNGFYPDDFIVDANLQMYLPLHLLKGSPIVSIDENKYSWTVTGALWKPNSRWFDGSDDRLTLSSAIAFGLGTMLFWIKSDVSLAADRKGFLGGGSTSNYIWFSNGTMYCEDSVVDLVLEGDYSSYDMTEWHLLTVVRRQSTGASIYLDDANLIGNSATVFDADNGNFNYNHIGYGKARWWEGNIGECWLYSRVLSTAEIKQIYYTTQWRYQ